MRYLQEVARGYFFGSFWNCHPHDSDSFSAVEDLSIDFLVVFENAKPKFYYSDVDDLLVDVTVLLHFEEGSRLSDHDIARLLAGESPRKDTQ